MRQLLILNTKQSELTFFVSLPFTKAKHYPHRWNKITHGLGELTQFISCPVERNHP
jgi:hypothetical protein